VEVSVDREFWARAWAQGKTGFHKDEVNPVLVRYADRLLPSAHETVFVPLCGQTLDMPWLCARGHTVVGAELVEPAVAGFFAKHGLDARAEAVPGGVCWRADTLEVLCGDVFELAEVAAQRQVTAIWDRGAMVALPPHRREAYVRDVLRKVAQPGARILLNVFSYDTGEMSGPPFSVPGSEVQSLFSDCRLELLESTDGASAMSRPDRPLTTFDIQTWLIELPA
jgi:thiopurine S-methyltransferase